MWPARLLLIAILVATPWAYGGVHEWAHVWIFLATAVAVGYTLLVQLFRPNARRRLPLAMYVVLAALTLGGLQLVSLPKPLVSLLSPSTVELRERMLPNPTSADADLNALVDAEVGDAFQTISLRPASTRYDLLLLALGVSAFFLGTQLFATARAQLWLYACIAVNGTCLAYFGLVQRLTWNGQLYWIGPYPSGGSPFASFVSRNSAGGYLNMCLGAALAVAFCAALKTRSHDELPRRRHADSSSRSRGLSRRITAGLGNLNARKLFSFGLAALLFGGVLCTASRGAIISAAAAGGIVSLVLAVFSRHRARVAWMIGAAFAGVALVAWVGAQGLIEERFSQMFGPDALDTDARLNLWQVSLPVANEFWQLGTGLGTFRDSYRMYEQDWSAVWYYHAENQYLEALIEGGAPGLLLMLAVIALVVWSAWKLLTGRLSTPANFACGVSCLFVLSTQVVHGFFDFSLYLPSNLLLLAVTCGAATALATAQEPDAHARSKKSRPRKRRGLLRRVNQRLARATWLAPLTATLLLTLLVLGWREASSAAEVIEALKRAEFAEDPDAGTQEQLLATIRKLESVCQEDDANGHYVIANLWVQLYRVGVLQQLRTNAPADVSLETLWQRTGPIGMHRRVYELAADGKPSGLSELGDARSIENHFLPAQRHLLAARQACPLLFKVHLEIAPLSVIFSGPAADQIHLQRACDVAPGSASTRATAGLLDLQANRRDTACRRWQRCLELDPTRLDTILEYADGWMQFEEIVQQVLPQSPSFLIEIAGRDFNTPPLQPKCDLLIYHALRLIDAGDLPVAEQHHLRARAYSVAEQYAESIRQYVFAIREQPGNAQMRYELSLLLRNQGYMNEAREHAGFAVRLEPENKLYERHREQLKGRK